MKTRIVALALSLLAVVPAAASAQGIMGEMHRDVNQVQQKFIDLAKAIPEAAYAWRPGTGTGARHSLFVDVWSESDAKARDSVFLSVEVQ